MKKTLEQIRSKIAHTDRLLQAFEQNKTIIIPSHDTVVDMYRVSLRVWRKLKATDEENTQTSEPHSLSKEDEAMAWYDQEIEKLKPIDEKIEHINKLLHHLRFQCYPLYQAQENLYLLDNEAKKLREKLEKEKSIKRCQLGQELQKRDTGFGLKQTWYIGTDENGDIEFLDSFEEQQKQSRKRKIEKLGLRIIRPETD